MSKPRIIIEVTGGLVMNVATDQPADVFLVDWDNIRAESDKDTLKEWLPFLCETGDKPDTVLSGPEFDACLLKLKAEIQKLIDKL